MVTPTREESHGLACRPVESLRRYPETYPGETFGKEADRKTKGGRYRAENNRRAGGTECRVNVDAAKSRRRMKIYIRVIFSLYRICMFVYQIKIGVADPAFQVDKVRKLIAQLYISAIALYCSQIIYNYFSN